MKGIIWIILQLISIHLISVNCTCAIEKDPNILTTCFQIDFTSIILDFVIKGQISFQPLCSLADRYIECIKVVSKGCIGSNIGAGFLSEIQNIALYCCDGVAASPDCILNPNVKHSCIENDAKVTMSDGTRKSISLLEIGDQVKTLDSSRRLVDTSVIMIMDKSEQKALFLNIRTKTNKSIKVSRSHLVALSNGDFKLAYKIKPGDLLLNSFSEEDIVVSIEIDLVQGYSAPVTLTGTILADDVLVSCYALIDNHQLAHFVMSPIRLFYVYSELNIFKIEKQENGIHWYPNLLHIITKNLNLIKFH